MKKAVSMLTDDLNARLNSEIPKRASLASSRWLGLIILGAVFVAMSIWSWRKWPDVFVDFGSQLYFPWQIQAGRDLYRDFEYVGGGPLSQYYHALLFKWFNVSMTTLVVSNLVILAASVVFVYEIFRRIADAVTATVIGLVILLIFAFSQYVWVGNYNFICAYSSEAVHGLVISIVTVVLLSRWLTKGQPVCASAAGIGLGLVFLTKPELFLALGLTVGLALVLALRLKAHQPPGFILRSAISFSAGMAVPLLASILFFWPGSGISGALRATAGAWVTLLTTPASKNSFYEWCLGFDHPVRNAGTMLLWFAGYVIAVGAAAWCCCQFSRTKKLSERVVLGSIIGGIVIGAFDLPWINCGWPLPLATLVIGSHFGWYLWKHREERKAFEVILPILWSGFALFLLSKMILHSRIWHYGFYLAMPAMVLNVFYLLRWLPGQLRHRGIHGALFRAVIMVVLGIGAFRLVSHSNQFYALKTYPVGSSADRILAFPPEFYPRSEGIAETAKWLDQHTPPGATLAVLPDGLILNYLARRANPTRYSSLTPLELAAFGEDHILDVYRARSPDYIVLMHRSSSEFNVGYFGQDAANGAKVMRWINQSYEPVWLWGSEPLQSEQFGMKVMRLKSKIATTSSP